MHSHKRIIIGIRHFKFIHSILSSSSSINLEIIFQMSVSERNEASLETAKQLSERNAASLEMAKQQMTRQQMARTQIPSKIPPSSLLHSRSGLDNTSSMQPAPLSTEEEKAFGILFESPSYRARLEKNAVTNQLKSIRFCIERDAQRGIFTYPPDGSSTFIHPENVEKLKKSDLIVLPSDETSHGYVKFKTLWTNPNGKKPSPQKENVTPICSDEEEQEGEARHPTTPKRRKLHEIA